MMPQHTLDKVGTLILHINEVFISIHFEDFMGTIMHDIHGVGVFGGVCGWLAGLWFGKISED